MTGTSLGHQFTTKFMKKTDKLASGEPLFSRPKIIQSKVEQSWKQTNKTCDSPPSTKTMKKMLFTKNMFCDQKAKMSPNFSSIFGTFQSYSNQRSSNPRMERQLFCRSSQKIGSKIKKCIVGSFPELSNFSVCGKNDHCGKKFFKQSCR